jgi:hypothetical protein
VADGDDELRAGEHAHLAELDGLALVDVARGSQDQEQRVAVSLELGALVRLDGSPPANAAAASDAMAARCAAFGRMASPIQPATSSSRAPTEVGCFAGFP